MKRQMKKAKTALGGPVPALCSWPKRKPELQIEDTFQNVYSFCNETVKLGFPQEISEKCTLFEQD